MMPAGLVVVRPTHFPSSHLKTTVLRKVQRHKKNGLWMMGRNVSLGELIAAAYDQDLSRIVIPEGMAETNFDFLVTVMDSPRKQLQLAIRKKLGFTAETEVQDSKVLALKVKNSDLPGLSISKADEKEGVNIRNGKLYYTNVRMGDMTNDVEQIVKMPVVDETGLTNFYDCSTDWNPQISQQLYRAGTARAQMDKILAGWGLALEPDTVQLEVLVVKRSPLH